uniref:Uncharacterized protein n=3 Tax=Enterobacteriaceae TaxID=543 RepID=A0A7G3NPU1_ECOLX|nr:hypothetical protein KGOCCACH_00171 [Klebsiella pneumoniae subsp. pneumoniae]QFG70644.1 hypothetical protein p2579_00094 [Klebsiella pneumoniae]QGW60048.1 hypothetical protein HPPIBGPI_00268 [Escherichia coli]QQM13081.1 hypothetical protein [Klebsiella pneumoniae]QVI03022.1 hypothetical protein [Klebsiella pneumoniae]
MISGYCLVKRLPQPFDMIDPRRVNRLINYPELRVCFQPTQRFTAFVDDVVIDNERNRFCPPVCRLQMF